ncbi:MAG: VOC family protein [Actinomycetota bacterium]
MGDRAGWNVQVTIDSERAHHLADWWAETLGWEVEPQDEAFIRSMIDQGFATLDDTETHRGALVWRGTTAIRPVPGADGPDGPRILFQDVPEGKTVKNRIHLDLRPPRDLELDELRSGVEARGATRIGSGNQGPHHWVVYNDPEGNEFCL